MAKKPAPISPRCLPLAHALDELQVAATRFICSPVGHPVPALRRGRELQRKIDEARALLGLKKENW
jgi:hypothetical protein